MKKTIIIALGIVIIIFSNKLGIFLSKMDVFSFDAYSDEMLISFICNNSWSFKLLGGITVLLPFLTKTK